MSDIDAIISDLEQERAAIDRAIEALRQVGRQPAIKRRGRPPGATKQPVARKHRGGKHKMSPEGKKRIAEAARKRWAAFRAKKKG